MFKGLGFWGDLGLGLGFRVLGGEGSGSRTNVLGILQGEGISDASNWRFSAPRCLPE